MLAAFFYLPGLLGGASIETLTDTALNGATQKDQIRAAQELSRRGGPALQALRNVAGQSQNASVVSVCILAISRQRDYPSMDLLLAKLDDSESGVRSSAATVLNKMLGRDYHFPAQGNKETRKRVRDWTRGFPIFNEAVPPAQRFLHVGSNFRQSVEMAVCGCCLRIQ